MHQITPLSPSFLQSVIRLKKSKSVKIIPYIIILLFISKNLNAQNISPNGNNESINVISDTAKIEDDDTGTKGPIISNGSLSIGGQQSNCSELVIDTCQRRIYGYKDVHDVLYYRGVGIGFNTYPIGQHSFTAGFRTWSAGLNSIAIGKDVRALKENSMIIGSGNNTYYNNTISNSLMIAFNASPNMPPSIFVHPSKDGLSGNVGISTKTPADKFQIGDDLETISFGSALNNKAGYILGYMGMNAVRKRTGKYHSSTWHINSDGASGAGIIATDAGGKMYIIPLRSCSSSAYDLPDSSILERRVVVIEARNDGSDCNALGDGLMKVHGKIWCKEIEVVVNSNYWWDEVFEPNYKLRTFDELKEYIEKNKHLPDVPSEKEVVEDGLNMGESYGILLRKIEELTLYVLELKKENTELRQMIENQSK